jgi:outer membrane protein assembly factor BamB
MQPLRGKAVIYLGGAFVWTGILSAQFGRGSSDWVTVGADAQRSSWVRADPKISRSSMQKPGFALLWKVKLKNDARGTTALTAPALLDRYIGYRGFRSLAFVGGSSDQVFALDIDLGRVEWSKPVASATPAAGNCGAMTANVTRPTTAAFPSNLQGGRGGGGRGGARSGVGEPGEGALTLAAATNASGPARGAAPPPPAAAGRGRGGAPGGFQRMPNFLHAISSDGMLHSMYVSNGDEPQPAVKFLPPNAGAQGLTIIDNVAYASTGEGCTGVPSGIWALDLESKQVASWNAPGGIAGSAGPAFGGDGTIYAATKNGDLVALEPKTLRLKAAYHSGTQFTSSPVIFEYKDKAVIGAAAKDGRIHLLDAALELLNKGAVPLGAEAAGALATWQDEDGTRWILAPALGTIAAWKVTEQNGGPALVNGWKSKEMVAPLAPMVMNGVVFALSGGQRNTRATLYALDGSTGKEYWNSGSTMTSFVPGGGLAGGGSQLYVGTYDGTLYAFGFPIEH